MKKVKMKKCALESCGKDFQQYNSLQKGCSVECEREIHKEKQRKKNAKKEDNLTAWLKSVQTIVNTYIRLRDEGKPCVSCGSYSKLQAGHLFSQGAHASVRFDEDNIHGQCFKCNSGSNFDKEKFIEEVINRTSEEEFTILREKAYEPKRWTIGELKSIQSEYLTKIKRLKNGDN